MPISIAQDDDDVLVVHGASRVFNPTLPENVVEDALKRDAAAARAEWLAEWRDDIAAFLSRELIEAAVDRGVVVRPPEPRLDYHAFCDPSGGLGDSFTAGIAHRDAEGHSAGGTGQCRCLALCVEMPRQIELERPTVATTAVRAPG